MSKTNSTYKVLLRIGRNDPCFCKAKRPNGKPAKYKNCCMTKEGHGKKRLIEYTVKHGSD